MPPRQAVGGPPPEKRPGAAQKPTFSPFRNAIPVGSASKGNGLPVPEVLVPLARGLQGFSAIRLDYMMRRG